MAIRSGLDRPTAKGAIRRDGGASPTALKGKQAEAPSTTKPAELAIKPSPAKAVDSVQAAPVLAEASRTRSLTAQQATQVVQELARAYDCQDERQLIDRLQGINNLADVAPAVPGGLDALGVPRVGMSALPGKDVVTQAHDVGRTLQTAFGPLGDLMYGSDATALKERIGEVRANAEQVKTFRTELAAAKTLPALAEVAEKWAEVSLPAQCRNEVLRAMMDKASGKDSKPFQTAAAFFERTAAAHPTHAADEIGRELYIVCLNKSGRLEDSILEAKAYIDTLAPRAGFYASAETVREAPSVNGEVLAGLGKAFKSIEEKLNKGEPISPALKDAIAKEHGYKSAAAVPADFDFARAALETSTRHYEAGFAQDFEYYPGIVSVYNNYEMGNPERAERLAPMVWQSCVRAGGKEATDYWCLATQLELALILGKKDELGELLPRVLEQADVGWKLSSTVSKMTTLAKAREQRGEDTKALRFVIGAFGERMEQLDKHGKAMAASGGGDKAMAQAFARDTKAWLTTKTASMHDELALPQPDLAQAHALAKREGLTHAVLANTADFRALTSSHAVGGNVAYGGQIPDITITRHSVRVVRELIESWGLDKVDDFATFNKVANEKLNEMLDLEEPSGRRPLEDLKSHEHHVLDGYDKNRFKLAATDVSGDSRTDLLAIMALGIGDCRPTAYAKQLLFDVWQHGHVKKKLGEALAASTRGNEPTYKARLAEADAIAKRQMRTVTVQIDAPVEMRKMYDWVTDESGRPKRDPSGTMNPVENHTFNILVELDDAGHVKPDVRAVDAFYQELYPLDGLPLSAAALLDGSGWQHGKMGTQASDGSDIAFRMTPTKYSGALLKEFEVGSSDFRFCGQTIAPPSVASFTGERERLNGLARGISELEL